jgi:hypothetical protein
MAEVKPPTHPMQPLVYDDEEIVRFKKNTIVRYLLDSGTADMNTLALMPFSDEDRVQFAQLIGYSVSGFSELSYVSDEVYDQADKAWTQLRNLTTGEGPDTMQGMETNMSSNPFAQRLRDVDLTEDDRMAQIRLYCDGINEASGGKILAQVTDLRAEEGLIVGKVTMQRGVSNVRILFGFSLMEHDAEIRFTTGPTIICNTVQALHSTLLNNMDSVPFRAMYREMMKD